MEVTELLATIQNEPNAAATRIEEALQAALGEGGEGAAAALLDELASCVSDTGQIEVLLKALDGIFRRHRESDLGRTAAWQAGLLASHQELAFHLECKKGFR